MRNLITGIFLLVAVGVMGQVASTACNQAQNICNSIPVPFPLTQGPSPSPTVPPVGSFSNPSSNPAGGSWSGCLFSGELNPNWFVLNITSNGPLEFQIGGAGGSGFFDWELWPYNPATGCTDIANNLVAPAACNWNAAAAGFTGMSNSGAPAGGNAGNFVPSIPVVAGQAYILMFSNYSFQSGNVNLTFPPTGATVGCSAGTPDQTICAGTTATVDLLMSPGWVSATTVWLVTNGVSNTTGITGVQVTPAVTTMYEVQVWDQGAIVDTIEFTINVVDPPTPNAGPDQNVCFGDPILLDGTQSSPTNTIQWGVNSSAVTPSPVVNFSPNLTTIDPTVTANQLGTYLFILTESNPTCGPRKDTVVVTISDLAITASSVAPTCEGFSDGEIHITSLEAVEYSFDAGATWVVDSFAVGFGAGVYNVCARTVTGCMKCVNVNVVDPPAVTIAVSNDTLICENGSAYLSASATGGTSYLFHWDNTVSTASTQTVTPTAATSYTVYAENENGCVSPPATINVTVRAGLVGTISPYDTICPGYPTTLIAGAAGGIGTPYNYVWSSGEMATTGATHSITANPAATQMYTVTITDACETTPLVMQTQVYVAPLPVPAYTVLDPEQCEPAEFSIVNTTDPALSQYVYWLVDGEQEFLNQNQILTDSLWAGSYDIQMIVTTYLGCVDSLTFTNALEVKPRPKADFRYSPNPVLMFNTTVNFQNYSINGYTYQWFFDGGYPSNSTLKNVTVQYPDGQTGTYDVMLITTSELGCIDTAWQQVVVFPEVLIYAPNTFTPDDDEYNQDWRIFMEGVDIYDFELLIFDRWGEVIWESHDIEVGWDGIYAGKPLPAGTYSWVVRTKDVLNDAKYTYTGHVNILR